MRYRCQNDEKILLEIDYSRYYGGDTEETETARKAGHKRLFEVLRSYPFFVSYASGFQVAVTNVVDACNHFAAAQNAHLRFILSEKRQTVIFIITAPRFELMNPEQMLDSDLFKCATSVGIAMSEVREYETDIVVSLCLSKDLRANYYLNGKTDFDLFMKKYFGKGEE